MDNSTPRISGTKSSSVCHDCGLNVFNQIGGVVYVWDDIPLCYDCWKDHSPNKTQRMIMIAIANDCNTTREIQNYVKENYDKYLFTTAITSNIWILRKEKYLKTESLHENGKLIKIELTHSLEDFQW